MPRRARTVFPGIPHHVTQRGNNRQDIFFTDEDRQLYLALFKQHALDHGLSLLGYCLMTNHVHIIAVPDESDSLARTFGRTHFKYAQILNHLHERSGHLWQDRFFSCALDPVHLIRAMAYIEMNPVRARLARNPWDYPWSSARAHLQSSDSTGLLDMAAWRKMKVGDWKQTLSRAFDKPFSETIDLHLRRGRPLGSDSFISKLEALTGHRLRALPHGRPRKKKEDRSKK